MISDTAARAFDLMQGIEVCRKTDPQFWRQLVTRIIYDLDEAGAAEPLKAIKNLLGQMWERLDEEDAKPGPQAVPLLGKRVRVTLDEMTVAEGVLLGFGDGGQFEVQQDDGLVYHAWPMLAIEEVAHG